MVVGMGVEEVGEEEDLKKFEERGIKERVEWGE